jgi:hypothetical protein
VADFIRSAHWVSIIVRPLNRTLNLGVIVMGRILIVLVALITMGTAASAVEILLSGPIHGSSSQNNATCYFFNGSGFNLSAPTIEIIGSSGVMPIAYSNCASGVLARSFCGIAVNPIAPNDAYACKITVPGQPNILLRGTMEVRIGNTTLQQTPVTPVQ